MSETVKIAVLKRGGNYREWAAQMEAYLTTQSLEAWLEKEPDATKASEVSKDKLAKARLLLGVSGGLLETVRRASSTKAAWDALKEDYLGLLKVQRPRVMGEIVDLKQGRDSLVEYIDRAKALRDQMTDLKMEDSLPMLCHQFVRGLHIDMRISCGPHFNALLSEGKSLDDITLQLQSISLLVQRGEAKVNVSEGKGKEKGDKKRKELRTCHHCGKVGHIKKNCWQLHGKTNGEGIRGETDKEKEKEKAKVSVATVNVLDHSPDGCKENHLWFDTGATHHIVCDETLVHDLCASSISTVVLGGGEEHDVLGQGQIVFEGGPSGKVYLDNVLLVPSLNLNLCSGVQVTDKGAECWQGGDDIVIRKHGKVLMTGQKVRGMYMMNGYFVHAPGKLATVCLSERSVDIWHKRFGHVSKRQIDILAKGEVVSGMKNIGKENECDVCVQAKQTRESFARSSSRASTPLELVHSDVMGPIRIQGVGGERYIVTLLDDYSRYSEVICVSNKGVVARKVIEVLLRWQRQTGYNVKILRTDRGTEFKGQLALFALKNGIIRQSSAPEVPEQNGRAERLNRTLIERTRAILFEHQVPKELWPDAMRTASYLRNRVSTSIQEKSPYELMYDQRPDVRHLRIFGCKGSVMKRKKDRDKFEEVGEECMMVGYAENSKAWRVIVLRNGKLKYVESPNVKFQESSASPLRSNLQGFHRHCDEINEQYYLDVVELDQGESRIDELEGESVASEELGAVGEEHGGSESSDLDDLDNNNDDEEEEDVDVYTNPAFEADEDVEENVLPSVYPRRHRQKPSRFGFDAYAYSASSIPEDNPATFKQAMKRPDADQWEQAVREELASLKSMGVFEESALPRGMSALPSKLVLTIKRDELGNVVKYKARLVAKGFKQLAGRDFDEVFAPTALNATFRVLLAIAAKENLQLKQLDVKTAFLYGELSEELYLKLPDELGGKVWRLQRALYGLKQAAREWHAKLRATLVGEGFRASDHDPCLFMKGSGASRVLLLVHVDDCLIVGNEKENAECTKILAKHFEVKDLGEAKFFLGQEIKRSKGAIQVSQGQYVKTLLQRFGMEECKAVSTPMEKGKMLGKETGVIIDDDDPNKVLYQEIVGSLLYLSVHSRPDLAFALGVLSRFMQNPTDMHFIAAKRLLRYLKGTVDMGLNFPGRNGQQGVRVYTDADFGGDLDKRRSTSGLIACLHGGAVLWGSKLQPVVATSTAEAEYIAAAHAAKEALWLRKILSDIDGKVSRVVLHCDNQSTLHLMTQHTAGVSGRTKHVDTQYHFVRDRFQRGELGVAFVATDEQLADMFTKALPGPALGKAIAQFMCTGSSHQA
jgi:transposase InsO family protein